jgi:glycosyltransferase involved in cell wall biosynthesis
LKVLAFTKYDREAASTRVRLLQFIPALAAAGITVEHRPLLSDDYVRSLAGGARPSKAAIAAAYLERLSDVLRRPKADLLWVYAELLPWLPAALERLILRHHLPLVYDMDDAFFVPYAQHRWAPVRRLLGSKLDPLLRGASAVTCGNAYLREHAARFSPNAVVVPTVVDTDRYMPAPSRPGSTPVIGWIGSPTTWANVRPLLPMLQRLHARTGARFRAVGAGSAAQADRFEGLDLIDWTEAREIAEVQSFTIGIMPLIDAPFQRGKSGYKLVQYMACGLPTVASPVGVNSEIVVHGTTGLLATSEAEWDAALRLLLAKPDLRADMGKAGRERGVEHYSLASQAPRLVELFRSLVSRADRRIS